MSRVAAGTEDPAPPPPVERCCHEQSDDPQAGRLPRRDPARGSSTIELPDPEPMMQMSKWSSVCAWAMRPSLHGLVTGPERMDAARPAGGRGCGRAVGLLTGGRLPCGSRGKSRKDRRADLFLAFLASEALLLGPKHCPEYRIERSIIPGSGTFSAPRPLVVH